MHTPVTYVYRLSRYRETCFRYALMRRMDRCDHSRCRPGGEVKRAVDENAKSDAEPASRFSSMSSAASPGCAAAVAGTVHHSGRC